MTEPKPTYNTQPQLLQTALYLSDIVYTPDWIAKDMVNFFKPSGRILEPCKGDGVFLKYLPPHTEWCEIEEGRDFFKWRDSVDWIVGNPPYKKFNKFFYHSQLIADDIIYLIPCNKAYNDYGFIKRVYDWGGVKHMRIYGRGDVAYFPMGYAIGAIHFQRGYTGPMYTTIYENGRDE